MKQLFFEKFLGTPACTPLDSAILDNLNTHHFLLKTEVLSSIDFPITQHTKRFGGSFGN